MDKLILLVFYAQKNETTFPNKGRVNSVIEASKFLVFLGWNK